MKIRKSEEPWVAFVVVAFLAALTIFLAFTPNKVEGEVVLEYKSTEKLSTAGYVFIEYDIKKYATAKNHESTIKQILKTMPIMESADEIDRYIQKKGKGSKVTGKMVLSAAKEYGVDHHMMLAIMRLDSQFGTTGLGAISFNPGNVGTWGKLEGARYRKPLRVKHHESWRVEYYADGQITHYHSWKHGVRGVARWLSKNKRASAKR